MNKTDNIKGIFTPNMVPLDMQGEINEEELRKYIDWLIKKGISGLYPNGSTGEFIRFSPEERLHINEIIADEADGRIILIAGAAEANPRDILRACEYYAELGYDAVAMCAPYYFRLSQETICEHYAEIARNSCIDIFLYNIPQFANELGVETVKRLSQHERIIGIKDSSKRFPQFLNMMAEVRGLRPDFIFLTGNDSMVVPALFMGAQGAIIATSGIVPETAMNMYKACERGDWEKARHLQFGLLPLLNALFEVDFPEGFRLGVSLRGFSMGQGRQPMSENQLNVLERMKSNLKPVIEKLSQIR